MELTKMSPFKSSPGSMVIQMLAWLSPGMLLREGEMMRESSAEEIASVLPSPCPPLSSFTDYLLNARRVHRLHGLVDAEKRPAPCRRKGRECEV